MPDRIVYYRVDNPDYPRNREIRERLQASGRFAVHVVPKAVDGGRVLRLWTDLRELWISSRHASAIVLAEMNWSHAPFVWVIAKLRRSAVVVDEFVGLVETAIGDWHLAREGSTRAALYRLQETLAIRSADLLLIDTRFRAEQLKATYSPRSPVVSAPVGAPIWAQPQPRRKRSGPLRVLYYGNYIPLHGLDLVLEAVSNLPSSVTVDFVLIGGGSRRAAVEQRASELGISSCCRFEDPVPEQELADRIAWADVVLGVFGPSPKARSVIANKVWQGLACGRTVLTQECPSLDEIAPLVSGLLYTSEPGSSSAISEVLLDMATDEPVEDTGVRRRLDAYVAGQFDAVIGAFDALVSKKGRQ